MEKKYISKWQFFTLIYAYILSHELTRGAYIYYYRHSSWIPILLAVPLSCLLFFIYSFIYKNSGSTDFKTAIEKVLGKFFAKIFFGIYFFYFLFIIILKLRDVGELVQIYIMQESSFLMIYGFYLFAAVYCAIKGIEVIARYSGIVFFITFTSFILFYILLFLVNEPDYGNLLPFMPDGFLHYVNPALKMAYSVPLGELFGMLVIFQHVRPEQKKKDFKTAYIGIASMGAMMLLISLTNIIFLEPEVLILGCAPIIRLWRRIDVEDFIQRLDIIVINILIMNLIIKTSVLLIATKAMADGIKETKKNKFLFYSVIAVIFIILLMVFVPDYTKLINLRYKVFIPYVKSVFEVFIPILIVIISFLRKKNVKAEEKQLEYNI
ncbi:MAG: GerAB/ArcD/ProY family transporter [Acholeplasmataceae bacterium]|nr:GerAB/ArcD/ProY family transporter [Acholeplasmataceae bacterium]